MSELFSLLKSLLVFFVFILILAVCGLVYRHYEKIYPSTQDATLQANILPISTNISERVSAVLVANDTLVKQNQILFTLDNTQETIAYQKALVLAQQDSDTYQRNLELIKSGAVTQEAVEAAQTALQASKANVASAKYNLDNTVVRAPYAGVVTNFYVQKGQYLSPTMIVGGLVIAHSAWIQANILEPFLEKIRVGQLTTFEFRMYPGIKFKGVVEDIGYGVQTASITTDGTLAYVDFDYNWVYLSKRFPVRIKVLSDDPFDTTPFRVGATVNVHINTEKYVQSTHTE